MNFRRVKSVNSSAMDSVFTKFPQETVVENIEVFKESLLVRQNHFS
jgi:hypothetical protein